MKYLLDTHTALWAIGDNEKLSLTVKSIIDDVSVPIFVSVVSAWEIALKISIGKLNFIGGSARFLDDMNKNGVQILCLKSTHIRYVESLPFHHRDPFDRILISTALDEDLILLTSDENIRKYDVKCVW